MKISKREWFYFAVVIALYIIGVWYVAEHDLSWPALFKAGILQERGVTGLESRVKEIDTPLSWNIPLMAWYVIINIPAQLGSGFGN